MNAEAVTRDGGPPERTRAVPGTIPALVGGAGPVAVRVFPGTPAQASEARRWVCVLTSAVGGANPDDIEMVAGELFANAVLHTRSGDAGGKVTVAVTADSVIHVHDYGPHRSCAGLAAGPPEDAGPREDCGWGLGLVAALCTGLAHMPAAWCPVAGPDDLAAEAGGCCTCCAPAPPSNVPPGAVMPGSDEPPQGCQPPNQRRHSSS